MPAASVCRKFELQSLLCKYILDVFHFRVFTVASFYSCHVDNHLFHVKIHAVEMETVSFQLPFCVFLFYCIYIKMIKVNKTLHSGLCVHIMEHPMTTCIVIKALSKL